MESWKEHNTVTEKLQNNTTENILSNKEQNLRKVIQQYSIGCFLLPNLGARVPANPEVNRKITNI